jgi:hypothetical protein
MNSYTFESLFPPQIKTYGENRKCRHEGCNQVLSIYNPHKYCHMHYTQLLIEDAIKADKKVLFVGSRGVPTY